MKKLWVLFVYLFLITFSSAAFSKTNCDKLNGFYDNSVKKFQSEKILVSESFHSISIIAKTDELTEKMANYINAIFRRGNIKFCPEFSKKLGVNDSFRNNVSISFTEAISKEYFYEVKNKASEMLMERWVSSYRKKIEILSKKIQYEYVQGCDKEAEILAGFLAQKNAVGSDVFRLVRNKYKTCLNKNKDKKKIKYNKVNNNNNNNNNNDDDDDDDDDE